jgi:WD40 repeat protein
VAVDFENIWSIAVHPAKGLVAAGIDQGDVIIIDPEQEGIIAKLVGHTTTVNALTFSKDGTSLISVSDDGICNLWDMKEIM